MDTIEIIKSLHGVHATMSAEGKIGAARELAGKFNTISFVEKRVKQFMDTFAASRHSFSSDAEWSNSLAYFTEGLTVGMGITPTMLK